MLRTFYLPLAGAIIFVLIIFPWGENKFSHSFQACTNQATPQQSPEGAKNEKFILGDFISVQSFCTVRLVDAHNGFFAAIASIVIAFFTIVLAGVTGRQAELTAESIDATKKIANAALAAELPIVLVQDVELSEWVGFGKASTVIGGGFPPERSKVRFTFHNYGRSVARLTSFCLEHIIVYDLPKTPDYKSAFSLPTGLAIQRDESLPIMPPDSQVIHINEDDMARIMEKSSDLARLWVYGYIGFKDFRGESHKTGFCYLWHSNQIGLEIEERTGFHEEGPEEYIYNT